MKFEKVSLPLAFVAIALLFLTTGFVVGSGKTGLQFAGLFGKGAVSSANVLFLTNPVTSFSGKVDKVQGNSIFVSQQFTLYQGGLAMPPTTPPAAGLSPSAIPTPVAKVISFKVNLTPNTQINRPSVFIPYLVKTVTPAPPPKLSIKDIKVGQPVTVNTNADLRTLSASEFDASSIQLPQLQNSLNGKISKISANGFTLKAFGPQPLVMGTSPVPPKETEYTVTLTNNTEISRYKQQEPPKEPLKPGETILPATPKPEEFSLADLAVDMQVTVFTDEDITSTQKLTALRIEPMLTLPAPTAIPAAPSAVPLLPTAPQATTPAQTVE